MLTCGFRKSRIVCGLFFAYRIAILSGKVKKKHGINPSFFTPACGGICLGRFSPGADDFIRVSLKNEIKKT